MTLRYVSAFAGIGGFDGAFDALGMECLLQIEKDKHASAVLAHHFPATRRAGDIADVTAADFVGRPDLLVGGFPCLGTSLGQVDRIGLDDKRSGYFFEFLRLVAESLPRYVVIENPRGILTSPGKCKASCRCEWCGVDRTGWDMHTVVSALDDLGYMGGPTGWWTRASAVESSAVSGSSLSECLEPTPPSQARCWASADQAARLYSRLSRDPGCSPELLSALARTAGIETD